MKAMSRATWPTIMDGARESLLILAPWIDEPLVSELFSRLPPVHVKVLFPRSTLHRKGYKGFRYYLREVMDINMDVEIRVIDEELAACLVQDGQKFFYSKTYSDVLKREGVKDTDTGIAMAKEAWSRGEDWS